MIFDPHRRSLGRSVALGLASMASVAVVSEAHAQRAVTLEAEQNNGYARIVAKWSDGDENRPQIQASVSDRVLVMQFSEPVSFALDPLVEALPDWVGLARIDPDGLTARLALRQQDVRVHLSESIDLTAIDILQENVTKDPADVVSPLVEERRRLAEEAAKAALPPPAKFADDLEVRGSHAADRTRLAFYWSEPVTFETTVEPGLVSVLFDKRANPDLARLRISPPEYIAGLQAEDTEQGIRFDIEIEEGVVPNAFAEDDDIIVLDIASEVALEAAREAERALEEAQLAREEELAAKKAAEAEAKLRAEAEEAEALKKAEAQASLEAEKTRLAPQEDQEKTSQPAEVQTADAPAQPVPTVARSAAFSNLQDASDRSNEQRAVSPQRPDELSEEMVRRETRYVGNWPDPAPPDGQVPLIINPTDNGLELKVSWSAPAPAAVFSRSPAVWIVFGSDAELTFDPDDLPAGYAIENLDHEKAIVLRVVAPEGMIASAKLDGPTWKIVFAPAMVPPESFLKPVREVSETGRQRIETLMSGLAGIVWFDDPAIGDEIAAAVGFGPTVGSTTTRSFIEAEMPATAHGLAIIPYSDDIQVTQNGERVVVASQSGGLAVSAQSTLKAASYTAMNTDLPTPGFIDFDRWGGLAGAEWAWRHNELNRALAARDPASRSGADVALELARFYIAHDLASEALGALRVAKEGKPLLEQEAGFLAVRGAAKVMLARYDEAEEDLSKGSLRGDDSAHIWRAYAAAEMRQWERANDFFKLGEELIFSHSPRWAARFYAKAAEAALRTQDIDRARQLSDRAASYGLDRQTENAALVQAELAEITEGQEAAYLRFSDLVEDVSEPVAVMAELRRLDLGVQLGKVAPIEAADALEALRFRWRGDDIEMKTIGILADQYMRLGRFREALLIVQAAALRDPDKPGARELRIRLMDFFERLYLDGEADRIDPIQALALFYEFKDLTPIGSDGDRMIRKLARRLVAFDLLEPATELLQHQVDNRVRGQGKAAIAADLAAIYLMDNQPNRALAAVNASRQPRLPKPLALERRLLEAAAHRDMKRYDHAIELMEGVAGQEAASIRADAHWRDGNWQEAAKELFSMLPPPSDAQLNDANLALRTAIAARMARDIGLLGQLSSGYASLFENTEDETSFDLMTSQTDISGAALSEAARRLVDAPRVDAFAAALDKRFAGDPEAQADETSG